MGKPDQSEAQQECRFSQEQYDMLKRCSDRKDITEWNQWRKTHPNVDVELDGPKADLSGMFLTGALLCAGGHLSKKRDAIHPYTGTVYLRHTKMWGTRLDNACLHGAHIESGLLQGAHLEDTQLHESHLCRAAFHRTHLERASLRFADLRRAKLWFAHLEGADLTGSLKLQGADFLGARVDQTTFLWKCAVNKYAKNGQFTDFTGVALDNMRIDPGTRQLLQYNIRRKNWQQWYEEHRLLQWPAQAFWLVSDYGLSTWRVIVSFAILALLFAVAYFQWPGLIMVNGNVGNIRGFVHALYFSVVTMTTLGFGDIAANPDSTGGQLLLMLQVILGYVLLGALVTRFAILFTAGGPSGTFVDEKGIAKRAWEYLKKKLQRTKPRRTPVETSV